MKEIFVCHSFIAKILRWCLQGWCMRHSTLTKREAHWVKNTAGNTPNSTLLHEDFVQLIAPNTTLCDIGCGNGRALESINHSQLSVVGVDINASEIAHARKKFPSHKFLVGKAQELPFEDASFDYVIALGLLGGIEKVTREQIVAEAYRVLKPNGILYVSEFARIEDPSAKTRSGLNWQDRYSNDAPITGEYGSFVVLPKGASKAKSFIAHHFSKQEMLDLVELKELQVVSIEQVEMSSVISGQLRPGWCAWAQKKSPAVSPRTRISQT
jgi:ubiquinone/menaquinone biosynthesis C-methylase UbiE